MAKRNNSKGKGNRNNQKANREMHGINQDLNNVERAEERLDDEARTSADFTRNRRAGSNSRRGYKPRIKGSNDVTWYAANAQLLNDAGQLSYNNPIGFGLAGLGGPTLKDPTNNIYVPGVMRISYLPGIGYSNDNTSAVNLAARRLYSYVRHANSGSANYDSPDLMMYVLAVNNVFSTYTECVRAYGIANVYSMYNRYMPDALLQAIGFDANDLRSNLANFRYGINLAQAKLATLAVPSDMPIFRRSAWMVSHVFKDSPTMKGQLYVFTPIGHYTYVEKTTQKPAFLQFNYTNAGVNGLTTQGWLDLLNAQIDAILESESMGIMMGDILKAYGADKMMLVPSVPTDYALMPEYDAEALLQINNATMTVSNGTPITVGTRDIDQDPDTGAILYRPQFHSLTEGIASGFNMLNFRAPLTIRSDSPTPTDTMLATRLMIAGATTTTNGSGSSTTWDTTVNCFGTEIPLGMTIYKYGINGTGQKVILPTSLSGIYSTDNGISTTAWKGWADLTKFDWHPSVRIHTPTNLNVTTVDAIIQDWDNVTGIGYAELQKLHETALLSMFNVPSMGY